METTAVPPEYVEFVAVVYHEGRNAAQLFRMNAASKKTFGELASLPPDDGKAWDRLIAIQQKAAATTSAKDAQQTFKEDFGCSLEDLEKLFGHDAWHRVPGHGGSRWASIAKSVIELGAAIDKRDEAAIAKLTGEIPTMHHNSGTVKDKLAKLKATRRR
ncbi:MAG TPA: hypothetical protein VJX23_07940 [Candidatus Binataceae bacterium]|nr:hypothetical protein [Candidatus Binataceae bacterium]